jgi:hypothetical protein
MLSFFPFCSQWAFGRHPPVSGGRHFIEFCIAPDETVRNVLALHRHLFLAMAGMIPPQIISPLGEFVKSVQMMWLGDENRRAKRMF